MPEIKEKKLTVARVLTIQALASFIVIGILILLGAWLVFKVMGTEYTKFTVMGFVAAVYMSFIVFQPAGTLFAARKELIEGKIILPESTKTACPVINPWKRTLPLSVTAGLICTAVALLAIHWSKTLPTPGMTVLISLLYVIPYYFITRKFIEEDLLSLAVNGPGSGTSVSQKVYFWGTFILPNIIFQSIINLPLANRGFSHEAAKLAQAMPGMVGAVPLPAVAADLTITFMFVCNFTFLAAATYTLSGIYQGIISLEGLRKGKGIHGFLFFLIMLAMGIVAGFLYALMMGVAGMKVMPFTVAVLSKFCMVIIAVYLGSRMALGWTAKKVRAHIAAASPIK